jgi:anti-sigma regulatory factor (Ser/Thr protein kinase)
VAFVRTGLPAGTVAVPVARRFTTETLTAWLVPPAQVEIAELVVSELVGNAVEHTGGPGSLHLSLRDGTLRITVTDVDPSEPTVWLPTPAEDRHRGMLIVSALTSRWGADRVGAGKAVWAEFDLAAADLGADGDADADGVGDRSVSA